MQGQGMRSYTQSHILCIHGLCHIPPIPLSTIECWPICSWSKRSIVEQSENSQCLLWGARKADSLSDRHAIDVAADSRSTSWRQRSTTAWWVRGDGVQIDVLHGSAGCRKGPRQAYNRQPSLRTNECWHLGSYLVLSINQGQGCARAHARSGIRYCLLTR